MGKRRLHTLFIAALFALTAAASLSSSYGVFGSSKQLYAAKTASQASAEAENSTAAGLVGCENLATAISAQPSSDTCSEYFTIKFHTKKGDFYYADKPIEPTDYLVADEIYNRRINAPLTEKRAMMTRAVKSGATYERAVTLCMPLVKTLIDEAERRLFVPAEDAQLTFNKEGAPAFTIRREREGEKLDREKAFELFYAAVRHKKDDSPLALPVVKIKPAVIAEQLINQTFIKADFYTRFNAQNLDRSHNIELALSKLNGVKIESGAEFSFNDTVGARTAENGFKEAKIIMDGEYVLGYGGGVCQASTTLYNAALRAGLKISMVKNHSLTASYVPPSLDAMVNSGSSDLRFINPLPTPVYLRAWTENGTARVRIYGERNEFLIVPKSTVLKVQPAPEDEKIFDTEHKYLPTDAVSGDSVRVSFGKDGIISEAYLEYYKDNKLFRREKIRSDSYRTARGVIAVAP